MTITLNSTERILQEYYTEIRKKGIPNWANDITPSIPLVGSQLKNTKVLAYGSAENLTYLNNLKPGENPLEKIGAAISYRHRFYLESHEPNDLIFPNVHIQPINDGSLLSVIRYIVEKLEIGSYSNRPYYFINEIAVANFGKFSIKSGKNKDYAQNFSKLSESLEYIIADIKAIEPDLIILPKTIYRTIDMNKGMKWDGIIKATGINKTIRFAKIYQTNQRVINSIIPKALKSQQSYEALDLFKKNWPVNKSLKGLDRYLKWIEQEWSNIIITA
jgi:hypothetical protein